MKKLLILSCMLLFVIMAQAQLKTTVVCPAITVDILKGRINNDLTAGSNQVQIEKTFPCFTKAEKESDSAGCGGAVYYADKDIYFYTARDYVEIGPNFKGKLSIPLMGAARNSLYKWLGNASIKDVNWDAFQTEYGILILYYNKLSKVNKIRFSIKDASTIKLCE